MNVQPSNNCRIVARSHARSAPLIINIYVSVSPSLPLSVSLSLPLPVSLSLSLSLSLPSLPPPVMCSDLKVVLPGVRVRMPHTHALTAPCLGPCLCAVERVRITRMRTHAHACSRGQAGSKHGRLVLQDLLRFAISLDLFHRCQRKPYLAREPQELPGAYAHK